MGLQRGGNNVAAVYRGATPITGIYRGGNLLWSPVAAGDDFTGPDGNLGAPKWTDLLSSFHKLGIEDGRLRLLLPDGLIGLIWDFTSSCFRYAPATGSGAFIEARAATQGDSASFTSINGYVTDVFHRGNNTGGSLSSGVGFRLRGGQVSIVSCVGGVVTERLAGGTFQSGDIVRVGSLTNQHTLLVNGQGRGTWNDAGGTVPNTSAQRSLIVFGQAAKDFLGPRRFSPALDYVRMG